MLINRMQSQMEIEQWKTNNSKNEFNKIVIITVVNFGICIDAFAFNALVSAHSMKFDLKWATETSAKVKVVAYECACISFSDGIKCENMVWSMSLRSDSRMRCTICLAARIRNNRKLCSFFMLFHSKCNFSYKRKTMYSMQPTSLWRWLWIGSALLIVWFCDFESVALVRSAQSTDTM